MGEAPAGFWVRFVAIFVDGIIVASVEYPLDRMLGVSMDPNEFNFSFKNLTSILISLILIFFYYGWFYKNKGATPGKMLMGLRVIEKNNGKNLSYIRTFFRETIGKFISAVIFGVGFLMVAFRPDKRALHDLIFDTQVLKKKNED